MRVLEELTGNRGYPRRLRSDNGPEFVAQAMETWADENLVEGEVWTQHTMTVPDRPFYFENEDAPPGGRTLTQYRDLWCVDKCDRIFLYQQTAQGYRRIRTPQDLAHEPEEIIWGGKSLTKWRIAMATTLLCANPAALS